MKPAEELAKTSEARAWIAKALDSNFQLKSDFLSSQGWSVVPVESGLHFDETDSENIDRAASFAGKTKLIAVLLEDVKNVQDFLEVVVSKDGLLLFSQKCAHFNYALVPDDFSFAIVCTTYDYFLVAGTKRFVEIALGKKIGESRSLFDEFASDESWSRSQRARLMEVSGRYKSR